MKSRERKLRKTGDMRYPARFLWWPMRMVTYDRKHTQWKWLERGFWSEVFEGGWGDPYWRKDRWMS